MTTTPSHAHAERHRAELVTVLRAAHRAAAGPPRKRFPSRFSPFIWSELTGRAVRDWCHDGQGVNHAIRQIHDFYGWMAKHGPAGLCAGTLYRTVNYLDLAMTARNGTQSADRSVHIEHSVPVADLENGLAHHRSRFHAPSQLHEFLVRHSVCVAFSRYEELSMGPVGVSRSRNDAFNRDGSIAHEFPFRRYLPLEQSSSDAHAPFQVINVVRNEPVDLRRFTFADHIVNLADASALAAGRDHQSLYSLDLFSPETWRA